MATIQDVIMELLQAEQPSNQLPLNAITQGQRILDQGPGSSGFNAFAGGPIPLPVVSPPVDLRQSIPQVQANQAPQAPKVPENIKPKQKNPVSETPIDNNSSIIKELVRLGVPLGAAIAGSVNPNLLPQATGLSTGFVDESQRQKLNEEKAQQDKKDTRDVIILGPDGTEEGRITIGANDIAKFREATPEEQAKALQDALAGIETPKGQTGSEQAIEEAKKVSSGDVRVKDKDGNEYDLPRDQLNEAIKQGYTLVNG